MENKFDRVMYVIVSALLYIIIILLFSILISSCSKEYSYEKQCGTIIEKDYLRMQITVQYNGYTAVHAQSYLQLRSTIIGQTYCP